MLKSVVALGFSCVGSLGGDPVIHPPQVVPDGWEMTGENADLTGRAEVLVGLQRSNLDQLEKIFQESSTPGSSGYLKHASWEEMGNLIRPSEEAMGAVIGMLASHGATDIRVSAHGDYISASAPMHELAKLTSGQFQTFSHPGSGRRIIRLTGGVKLPAAVAKHVETFSGLHGFPLDAAPQSSNGGTVTPDVISKQYNIGEVSKSGKQNIQSIGQFQGQYVKPSDLSQFCKQYDSGADCSIAKFVGQNTPTRPGIESMLDTEYIMGLGKGITTWVYSYPSFDFCKDLLQWASDVAGESTHPNVVSLSYGSQKIDFCDKTSASRLSQDVQKLGAMGVTVVIASGDDGSGDSTRQGSNYGKLSPSYPASIPYALAVGSTYFQNGQPGPEEATTQFGSGGGFSYDFTAPSYQTSAVQAYLAKNPIKGTQKAYAKNGRGSPDVALLGEQFQVIENGHTLGVGGTSASTPSWGAIISLLNEECLTASGGKKVLGFVNPLLYQHPEAFNDITVGSNAIGGNAASGWKCTEGWDAATGLGTPKFDKLQAIVKTACAGGPKPKEEGIVV